MSSLKIRSPRPSGTTLWIAPGALDDIHRHAARGYPREVVGILAGDREGHEVRLARPLVNALVETGHDRYRVDALDLWRAERELEAEGLEVVGYYHSHPDHPASYSDTDLALALPHTSYVIASVYGPASPLGEGASPKVLDTRSWRLRDDRSEMDAEPIHVHPRSPRPPQEF